MKVLLVNRYLSRVGGDATYTLQLARLLKDQGHKVVGFGVQADPSGELPSPVLMDPIDFPALLKRGGAGATLRVLGRTIYSPRARALMDRLLLEERPDIVHLQNIHHHLTPSIISAAAKRGVPVVWTLHDYTVVCPNGNLWSNGRSCEECRPVRFHRAIVNRCKRDSVAASSVAAIETAAHRLLGLFKDVRLFIAPSRFMQGKLRDFGFFPDRVIHLDNFVPAPPALSPAEPGRSVLYAGRLIEEKGIRTLLEAAARWGDIPLVIAGDGPLRPEVVEASRLNPSITYLGHVGAEELGARLLDALAAVLPSTLYENQPFSVLEAFAAGRPVIGSNLGGLPELIGEDERGLLFPPHDAEGLAAAVRRLASKPSEAREMGKAAIRLVQERFSPEDHYENLMHIYRRAGATGMGRAA